MNQRWPKRKLGEVADLCLGKMLDQKKNRGEYQPYIGNIHVRWGKFDLESLPQMRFEGHEHDRFGLRRGDIVVCEGGEPGRCALWKEQVPNLKFQKALHRVRPQASLLSDYLFYWFLNAGKRNVFQQYCTGSTIKHLPGEKLAIVEVDVPPVSVQRRIAAILSGYDDLIENNTRRIQVLERMAQAIYREWFVNFRFPGHAKVKLAASPLGPIPQGWEVTSLKQITSKIGSGATPRGGREAYHSSGITLIRSLNVYDYRFADEDLAFINAAQAAQLDNVSVEKCDILLNITGASVARCCLAPSYALPARVNQHVAIIRVDPRQSNPYFVLDSINSVQVKQAILGLAQGGATREALTKETVSNLRILHPPKHLLERYGGVAGTFHDLREVLHRKNINLRRTRDLLLPRLLAGQLKPASDCA